MLKYLFRVTCLSRWLLESLDTVLIKVCFSWGFLCWRWVTIFLLCHLFQLFLDLFHFSRTSLRSFKFFRCSFIFSIFWWHWSSTTSLRIHIIIGGGSIFNTYLSVFVIVVFSNNFILGSCAHYSVKVEWGILNLACPYSQLLNKFLPRWARVFEIFFRVAPSAADWIRDLRRASSCIFLR